MSVGPTSLNGSFAATPLSQSKASEQLASQREGEQARTIQADQKAEMAAGVGQTEEQGDAQDRDADGRRPWELPARTKSDNDVSDSAAATPRSLDASRQRGNQLDVSG